jgi:hypothetical protein
MIDKNSAEYMLGQIMARLEEGDRVMTNLTSEVRSLTDSVDELPCKDQGSRLLSIENWRKEQEKDSDKLKEVKEQGKITLKNGIILCVVSALVSAVVSIMLTFAVNSMDTKVKAEGAHNSLQEEP